MVSGSGCQAGGTHFTEHENYRRITYDSVADAWTVEGKDGTRRQYTSVWTLSSVTHRWGLTSVTDTLGNTVTYGWWNDAGKNLYPSDVTYNSYQVKIFYRSDPTDRIAFATGLSLGATRQLIRSIQVGLDDGTPIRAYELEYSTSSSTGRSRLDSGREGRRDDHRLRRGLPEFPRR